MPKELQVKGAETNGALRLDWLKTILKRMKMHPA